MKDNTDYLATTTLDTLATLILEKRNNRKSYYEEHTRICNDLNKLQVCLYKRHFIIDQQIGLYFVQYIECLSNTPSILYN